MLRTAASAFLMLISIGFSVPAVAQESWWSDVSVSAAFGGSLPYSTGSGGYLVTQLMAPDATGRAVRFAGQSPFGTNIKNVFDGRPQVGLGGRYDLRALSGGGKVSVRAMVSAGVEPVDGPRPMVGLAGLSVLF
jgi:hypothetical protein